ncbi:MAG TPA: NnrU family protein [Caulobacteraceae bacterium]|nr:NnrU family protein [Caulobacteraceae bacterium]
MLMLVAAAAAFIAIHFLISGTSVRDRIVAVTGEGAYLGIFSLASIGALVWMIIAFGGARASAQNQAFWGIGHATRDPAILLVFIAFLFAVPGLLTNSPTRVRGDAQVDKPTAVTGMTRITRHPFLWGAAIWAVAHIIANGRLADLILFGGILITALLGPLSIDAKRRRALGDRYRAFEAKTSNIPFAAIVQGRQQLKVGEIWWRLLVAVAVWAAVLWAHPYFTGGIHPLG